MNCPQCGHQSIVTVPMHDDNHQHQHTWYVCTHWATTRCGWTGWYVPDGYTS